MAILEQTRLAQWVDDRLALLEPSADWDPSLQANQARLDNARRIGRRHRPRVWVMTAAAVVVVVVALFNMPVARAVVRQCGEWLLAASRVGSGRHGVRPALPDFSLVDVEGRSVALSSYQGKAVLLTFWTTTCDQCQRELPWFRDFQQTYARQGFVVLGVALDREGWASVTPYLDRQPVNYPVVLGNRERAQSALGLSIPTTLILDRAGRIAVRHVGFCSRAEYQRDIEKLLNE
jgi:peroxiredoxin